MLYGRLLVYVNDPFLDPEAQTLWSYGHWAIPTRCMLVGCQPGPKDSKESPLYLPGTQVLISLERWVPKGSTPAHMEGSLPWNTFYPDSSQDTRTQLLDSLLTSQAMKENRRGHSISL